MVPAQNHWLVHTTKYWALHVTPKSCHKDRCRTNQWHSEVCSQCFKLTIINAADATIYASETLTQTLQSPDQDIPLGILKANKNPPYPTLNKLWNKKSPEWWGCVSQQIHIPNWPPHQYRGLWERENLKCTPHQMKGWRLIKTKKTEKQEKYHTNKI